MTVAAVLTGLLLLLTPPLQAVDTMTTPINIPGLQLEGGTSAAGMPTTILCLMNMVSLDELRDDEEYEGVQTVVAPSLYKHITQSLAHTRAVSRTVALHVEL